ncbi:MAG: carboxypeptidase-like regulatory domain-containing protein [Firmicutes bacterium]|nr:carboxypeptidase-like regulatory domain-containing protein [Bacillota bacterium]
MKKGFLLLCVALSVLMLFGMVNCGSSSDGGSSSQTVTGRVTDADTQLAIAGATCELQLLVKGSGARDTSATTTTDSQGYYSFQNIDSGDYVLTVTLTNYVTSNSYFTVSGNTSENVALVSKDKWTALMGESYPYDSSKAYIFVNFVDNSALAGKKGKNVAGVDADIYPANIVDMGILYNGDIDWSAEETQQTGQAVFYGVLPEQAYQIFANKPGYSFEALSAVTPKAGEVTICTMRGDATQTDTYTTSIQRVADQRPIKGICYKPGPHDYKEGSSGIYYDSDFYNEDFKQLWGDSGRDDVGNLRAAGVNFLHLYDWNQPGSGRDHSTFLNYCQTKSVYVAYPVSAYFVVQVGNGNGSSQEWITNMVNEAYPNKTHHPAVLMWSLGNEFDLGSMGQNATLVAKTAKMIVDTENSLGIPESEKLAITAPVSFALFGESVEGIKAIKDLKAAFEAQGIGDVFKNRFIITVNPFKDGASAATYAQTTFPQATAAINGGVPIPFMFFEYGKEIGNDVTTEDEQAAYNDTQLSSVLPIAQSGPFFGLSFFETENSIWKTGTEATFGVYKIKTNDDQNTGVTTNGTHYPVDAWEEKPNFQILKKNYN